MEYNVHHLEHQIQSKQDILLSSDIFNGDMINEVTNLKEDERANISKDVTHRQWSWYPT